MKSDSHTQSPACRFSVLLIFADDPNLLCVHVWSVNVRLYSKRWWGSAALFLGLCTPGARSRSWRARNGGRSCCQKPAGGRRRRCGPSHCCRCSSCLAWAQPACWGKWEQAAGFLGHSDACGTSRAPPPGRWRPPAGGCSRTRPTPTRLGQRGPRRRSSALFPSPDLSGKETRKREFFFLKKASSFWLSWVFVTRRTWVRRWSPATGQTRPARLTLIAPLWPWIELQQTHK